MSRICYTEKIIQNTLHNVFRIDYFCLKQALVTSHAPVCVRLNTTFTVNRLGWWGALAVFLYYKVRPKAVVVVGNLTTLFWICALPGLIEY